MDIPLDEWAVPQPVMKHHVGHHIGLKPVLGMLPALGHHPLGRKIDNVGRSRVMNKLQDCIEILVQVESMKLKLRVVSPTIGEQRGYRLDGPTHTHHRNALVQ